MGPPDRRDNPVDVAKQRLEAPITHYSRRSGFCEMLGRTGTRSRRGSWSGALCMHSQALWRMLRLRWRRFQAQGYYCASRAYQRPSSVQSDNPVVVIMVLLEAQDEKTMVSTRFYKVLQPSTTFYTTSKWLRQSRTFDSILIDLIASPGIEHSVPGR